MCTGADPGFLERGFICRKGWGSLCWSYLIFLKKAHENEILWYSLIETKLFHFVRILIKGGGGRQGGSFEPPLDPLLFYIYMYVVWCLCRVQLCYCLTPPPPHTTGRRFRYAHGDLGFSLKFFQIAAEALIATRFGDLTLPLRIYYASVTLLLRSYYDNEDLATLSLRWWRCSCDLATTLAMELCFRCSFVSFFI